MCKLSTLFFCSLRLDNTRGTFADSGTYALMGAAGTFKQYYNIHTDTIACRMILDLDSTLCLLLLSDREQHRSVF